ncbi:regulatory protein ICP22 [Macacine alphaherpesvirus 1]|uniref:Regulatory protein ICP22 n=1 Tax=Cercopithecine herpesvirus 1 TaxID=10325 RepID=A0A059WP48_CHV1|nr:regulatory protein ICP22 [Macacine alphaherpesvirus 1]
MPTNLRKNNMESAGSSPSSSPVQNRTKRRCVPVPSLSDSDTESDCSSGVVIPGGGNAGSAPSSRRPRARGSPRVAGGMYFIDDEAESGSEPESEAETEADFESVSEADLESVSELTSGVGSDTESDSSSECSGDELREDQPQQIRINIRLVSSPDRRAGVVFPESRGTRSSPGTEAPPPERRNTPERRSPRARGEQWELDLPYMRRSVNHMFRLLRRSADPHGAANRLRRLIRDSYLMGYTRRRLEPGMWSHLLQVAGGRAFRLRNVIEKVVSDVGNEGDILPLPPSPREHHGVACDHGHTDSGDDDDHLGLSDPDTPDDSDATLESDAEGAAPSAPGGLMTSSGTGATGGALPARAPGSLTSRLEREFAAFDWTSDEGSQPWLSSVVADTSSAERRRADSPGPRREKDTPGSCRRMRFPTTCPYPCGHTFLRM